MVPKQRFTGTFSGAARPRFRARLILAPGVHGLARRRALTRGPGCPALSAAGRGCCGEGPAR